MPYIISIIFIFIQSLLALVHWFFYKTMVRTFGITNPALLATLKFSFGFLAVCFILASLLASRYFNIFTRVFYAFSAVWMGFLFYFFLSLCAFYLALGIFKIFSIDVNLKISLIVLLGIAGLISFYGTANARIVKTTKLNVKLNNLPLAWQNKTAVFVSDTHFGQIYNLESAKKIVTQINSLNPEVVFIGGDFFDGQKANDRELANVFKNLKAPLGTYFITGNHEEFSNTGNNNPYLEILKQAGIKILNNEMVDLNGLQLAGVDYSSTRKADNLKDVLEKMKINPNQPSILLKHEPSHPEIAEKLGVSLMLSGHTHNGQMFPNTYLVKALYGEYGIGLNFSEKMPVYTSFGAGTWGPPLRIVNRPEIVQITFQ